MELDLSSNVAINMLTLEYLINNSVYDKIKNSNTYMNINNNEIKKWKKDIKFYRHRILDLTKQFIKNRGESEIEDESINESFKNYAKSLIIYFKKQDLLESIKQDNVNINTLESALKEEEKLNEEKLNEEKLEKSEESLEKANNLISNVKRMPINLDNFVIKRKKKDTEEAPKKKEINLTDPKFKKKGIRKKIKEEENITSN